MIVIIGPDKKTVYRESEIDQAELESLKTLGYSVSSVVQVEELVAMGGKFYKIDGTSFCDTRFDTWQLLEGVGFVCLPR